MDKRLWADSDALSISRMLLIVARILDNWPRIRVSRHLTNWKSTVIIKEIAKHTQNEKPLWMGRFQNLFEGWVLFSASLSATCLIAVADLGKVPGARRPPPPFLILGKREKKKIIAVGREASRASDKKPPPLLLAQGLDPPLDCNFTRVCESHQNVDTYLVCLLTSCMISNALIPGGVAIIHCAQIIARAFAFIRFTSCCCVILQDKKKKIYLVNLFYSS